MNAKEQRERPLLGILTSLKDGRTVAGNIPLFKDIQTELARRHKQSIVFSYDHLYGHSIKGAIYHSDRGQWETVTTALPMLVYNRIPFRKDEQTGAFRKALALFEAHGIPVMNTGFLDKYSLFQQFSQNEQLKEYFLPTLLVTNKKVLVELLNVHRSIYIKKTQASKGAGIYRLTLRANGHVTCEDVRTVEEFASMDSLWKCFGSVWSSGYIAQAAVSPMLYEGKRYDLRVLGIYDGQQHVPVGIGVRQAGEQQVTTHVPTGGKILPYSLFQTEPLDKMINMLVKECGRVLQSELGRFVEFSLDIGCSDAGDWYIYEINSKPMSFDEPTIESARVKALCQLFEHMVE